MRGINQLFQLVMTFLTGNCCAEANRLTEAHGLHRLREFARNESPNPQELAHDQVSRVLRFLAGR